MSDASWRSSARNHLHPIADHEVSWGCGKPYETTGAMLQQLIETMASRLDYDCSQFISLLVLVSFMTILPLQYR